MKFLYNQLILSFFYIVQSVRGLVALSLYIMNIVFGFIIILSLSIVQWIPLPKWRSFCRKLMDQLPVYWIALNTWIQKLTIPHVNWKVYFKSPINVHALSLEKWYLLISNHKSWVDILVLQRVFNNKIPPLKFFMKSVLLWTVPLIGWMCWLLGFPIVRRYAHKQLVKNPLLKKHNREVARVACERYKHYPTTITNFVEGGRFSQHIHLKQNTPYQYLLHPHSGGVATVLSVLENYCHHLLNVTIIYYPDKINLWNFVCGRISKIFVYVEILPVPSYLVGDYENDPLFRTVIQRRLNDMWSEKDQLMQGKLDQGQWVQWIE